MMPSVAEASPVLDEVEVLPELIVVRVIVGWGIKNIEEFKSF